MRFIRIKDVLELVGVSRTTLWRMVRDGAFPRRVAITKSARGHVYEEVEAWMQSRANNMLPGVPLSPVAKEPPRSPGNTPRPQR
jgi:prophage regulatory protein